MLNEPTLEKLQALKLTGMREAFEDQLAQPATQELAFEERLALLLDREILARDNRRLTRLLKAARLRIPGACLEDVDYRHARGLQRPQMAQLGSCQWIHHKQNLLLTGPTGTGKTYLACALGNQACRQGLSTRYVRLPRLLEAIHIAHADGSYPRLMQQLARTDLLILDDWAIAPLTASQRQDLMELIEDRHGLRSTLIASQLPVEHWHDYLGEPTLADAILDRLLHNAHRLPMKGASMRQTTTTNKEADQ